MLRISFHIIPCMEMPLDNIWDKIEYLVYVILLFDLILKSTKGTAMHDKTKRLSKMLSNPPKSGWFKFIT